MDSCGDCFGVLFVCQGTRRCVLMMTMTRPVPEEQIRFMASLLVWSRGMRQMVTQAVEDVERVRGVMDYVKAVCTAFGTIGIGALISFFAPESLQKEIPVYRELGLGFMAFGGLFVLALFLDSGPGSAGQRAKSFLLAMITGTFAVGAAVSQLGPAGVIGDGIALLVGIFSLSALWEVVSGKPVVTKEP